MSKTSLFDSYLHDTQPYAEWKRLRGTNADGDVPSPRGGHAMCMDPINDMIYLLGGWDGEKSLDDFWVYSVKEDKWQVLSHSTSEEKNAPAVVDHSNVKETETFRSLLTHLLKPSTSLSSPSSMASTPPLLTSVNSSNIGTVDGGDVEMKDENEDEDRYPPRKRSRSRSPKSDQDTWTNKLHEDELSAVPRALNVQVLLQAEDPREKEMRISSTGSAIAANPKLTAARFKQRNEVFESLLEFVSESAKQPSEDLLDIICVDKFDE
ncbi:hypothetical protein C0993_003806 [Termitomyces sp. T159_Od127]|nr:hypothetical protein C0993_003806 [Termitomyces sp. T159_Od127]